MTESSSAPLRLQSQVADHVVWVGCFTIAAVVTAGLLVAADRWLTLLPGTVIALVLGSIPIKRLEDLRETAKAPLAPENSRVVHPALLVPRPLLAVVTFGLVMRLDSDWGLADGFPIFALFAWQQVICAVRVRRAQPAGEVFVSTRSVFARRTDYRMLTADGSGRRSGLAEQTLQL